MIGSAYRAGVASRHLGLIPHRWTTIVRDDGNGARLLHGHSGGGGRRVRRLVSCQQEWRGRMLGVAVMQMLPRLTHRNCTVDCKRAGAVSFKSPAVQRLLHGAVAVVSDVLRVASKKENAAVHGTLGFLTRRFARHPLPVAGHRAKSVGMDKPARNSRTAASRAAPLQLRAPRRHDRRSVALDPRPGISAGHRQGRARLSDGRERLFRALAGAAQSSARHICSRR